MVGPDKTVKLILPVWTIPTGTVVTKPTGTVEYILYKEGFKIYAEKQKKGDGPRPAPVVLGKDMYLLGPANPAAEAHDGEISYSMVGPMDQLAVHFAALQEAWYFTTDALRDLGEEMM